MDPVLLWTAIGAIGACAGTAYIAIDHRDRKRAARLTAAPPPAQAGSGHPADDTHLLLMSLCQRLANSVSSWFKERFTKMALFARAAELNSGDAAQQKQYLESIATQVDGFDGGLYALDAAATVRSQHTPKAPTVPNITGYIYDKREYFTECRDRVRPIVSNVFTSHNRAVEILVVAAPRFDDRENFIGILDGVIDVVNAPFSTMARTALRDTVFPDHVKTKSFRLIVVDKNKRIIGSSHSQADGRSSVAENPVVQRLFHGIEDNPSFSCGEGAIVRIDATPFFAICHEHALAKSS